MNILEKICSLKKIEVEKLKSSINYKDKLNISKRRNFHGSLKERNNNKYNLIAEIKKASPSKGEICKNFNLLEIARDYEKAGASCLSVLTEKQFFKGDINYIKSVKDIVKLPILRKDFILDEWQIYESYYHGADCILLILAMIDDPSAYKLYKIAEELDLDVIVEVHELEELNRAIKMNAKCIGINNRNLKTLNINLNTFKKLSKEIPEKTIKICESGIKTNQQIVDLASYGADAFLIGESLMSSQDIKIETSKLIKK